MEQTDTDREVFGHVILALAGIAPAIRDKFIDCGIPHTHLDITNALGRTLLDALWENPAVKATYLGPLRLLVEAELSHPKITS
jgi:hypothetical protein